MKWNNFRKRVRYYLQYFPFTLNAVLAAIALWFCFRILKPGIEEKDAALSSFRPLILLMGKTALFFVLALVAFSILTTIACWLYFLWLQRNGSNALEFSFKPTDNKRGLWMETLLLKARRPFLGFIKGRLLYDQYGMTDKFILASNKKRPNRFWREGIMGRSTLTLPDVKEYTIEGGFVYFEDMLQLCSLPVRQNTKGHIYQAPRNVTIEERDAVPRKTEQTDIRIDQLRKVQGEFLNYKDFESGDDVRRVVWKVYARSRELVVRVPEIFDPYASHIYFYASFFDSLRYTGYNSAFSAEMLNYYKNSVWTAYETLAAREWELKYVPDQELHVAEQASRHDFVMRVISNSSWQTHKALADYFQPRFGAVLVVSSFDDAGALEEVLDQCSADTVVYYVKLSDTFRNFLPWTWFKRLFFLAPDDRLKRIRSRWLLHPLRFRLQKREREIEAVLERSNVVVGRL